MYRGYYRQTLFVALSTLFVAAGAHGETAVLSDLSKECISCHSSATPAIVADWKKSRHASVTPAEALKKPEQQRRVSAEKIPEKLASVAVGCAECHLMNPDAHKDTFDHNDQKTHLTVTPQDCATCHPTEAAQFDKNLMSHANGNLANNSVYQDLMKTINGMQSFKQMKTELSAPNEKTAEDSCWSCHGTALEVTGMESRSTDYGDFEFPKLSGWPNQGVGRLNPDGSKGSCSACHNRHQFAMEAARKPYTCSRCHKGPDVPAYQAYSVSNHGNLFSSLYGEWKFKEVPWTVGKDFTAPTCAVCHVSLLVTTEGDVVAKRTHQMNDRLPWRIFGPIYAYPHPKSPDTSIIRNKGGMPLPATLEGETATEFVINAEEQAKRKDTLQKVCRSCHTLDWVNGHWERFENAIKTSNQMTLTATNILGEAWKAGAASRTPSIFDETIEKQWIEQWLFYANSTRFASAMMGADYGVFADGRWFMSKNIQKMSDYLKFLLSAKGKKTGVSGETKK
jgi:hydroxylamine dehydrogenase